MTEEKKLYRLCVNGQLEHTHAKTYLSAKASIIYRVKKLAGKANITDAQIQIGDKWMPINETTERTFWK